MIQILLERKFPEKFYKRYPSKSGKSVNILSILDTVIKENRGYFAEIPELNLETMRYKELPKKDVQQYATENPNHMLVCFLEGDFGSILLVCGEYAYLIAFPTKPENDIRPVCYMTEMALHIFQVSECYIFYNSKDDILKLQQLRDKRKEWRPRSFETPVYGKDKYYSILMNLANIQEEFSQYKEKADSLDDKLKEIELNGCPASYGHLLTDIQLILWYIKSTCDQILYDNLLKQNFKAYKWYQNIILTKLDYVENTFNEIKAELDEGTAINEID